ncbi:MAG: NAD-dependent epimerase/dehydratase family protein [Marinobacter nauticus]
MTTYLVTGGAGFIGSHLVDALLAADHAVVVVDDFSTGHRKNLPQDSYRLEIVEGSITDRALMADLVTRTDACFHLAAVASVQKSNEALYHTHKVNLGAFVSLMELAAGASRDGRGDYPVVYASSAAVYGDKGDITIAEDAHKTPLSAYGADKLGCELHASAAGIIHGVKSFGLRFFNVFGPRQDPSSPYSGVISIFVHKALAGEHITIFGDGGQTRDFVYVSDVVAALQAAMGKATATAPVLNVCRGEDRTIAELAQTVLTLVKRSDTPVFEPARPGDIRHSKGCPNRITAELDWHADTGLADGLALLMSHEQPS